jgi:wyosine [tRNA(Phe)-imidazoG37] synthetase (radical SAM superfamily)
MTRTSTTPQLEPGETTAFEPAIAFGPIPSRRLGRSLGINNIPPKVCTYSCLYCQAGPTTERPLEPRVFYAPEDVAAAVTEHLSLVRGRGDTVDHLTFAPDGEPTLDSRLGQTIRLLRPLGVDIAVFTNSSLLWRREVRAGLRAADWVSVKVDAVDEATWRRVDRPHPDLDLTTVLRGIQRFEEEYEGTLVSETMLVDGINDDRGSVESVARFLSSVRPSIAYLAIPTRPTPYRDIVPPGEAAITRAYRVLCDYLPRVECILGYEGDAFSATGDAEADILAITAVHPLRPSAISEILTADDATWDVVDRLVARGDLAEVEYRGEAYFVRRWRR